MSALTHPKKAVLEDWHRADIVAALHKKGWSLRELSLQHGLSPHTLKSALDRSYPKCERIIAAALGMEPEAIWARRYAIRNFKPVFPARSPAAANTRKACPAS
ncbi:helix-turn-helix domain-containing protein [Laribacter hongkongensis]|uniref:Helix-turn-helix domain-containing protein n=1 Tax=Laribacter hongkongensis TaxID=168471 RepID=A0ABD4SW85_9NEIS|nr:helix-turn-helix domain-containing protein [Laribacter hongkongensis]MCG9027049.1 helix-turn-helix domain-containing protein [Laribacter hongkongensis]MCG9031583.1 helix-turn-helix domain-containing protein [Laribacter hongkongensis]MCG9093001.1 helix-turn-helix domain-containing protein [Laribacter hongkongensis]